jgi:hypothetical protein
MLFAAVLVSNPLDLAGGFEGGIGLAALAVPAFCMLGGYAIAGRGPRWVRGICGLVTLSAIPIWSLTATGVGGSSMSLADPHGAWAAVLYWSLLATFSMAAAIPYRRPVPPLDHQLVAPARRPSRHSSEKANNDSQAGVVWITAEGYQAALAVAAGLRARPRPRPRTVNPTARSCDEQKRRADVSRTFSSWGALRRDWRDAVGGIGARRRARARV